MSTRAKYIKQKQPQQHNQPKPQTDIIMRFSPSYGKYISRAFTLLFGQDKPYVTIKAAEKLIDRALWVAQVIKRKVAGLHQIINITQNQIIDVYLPKEQGLLKVEKERFLTVIEVTLTRDPTTQQKKHPGYQRNQSSKQAPIKIDENETLTKLKWQQQQKQREQKQNYQTRQKQQNNRGDERRRGRR